MINPKKENHFGSLFHYLESLLSPRGESQMSFLYSRTVSRQLTRPEKEGRHATLLATDAALLFTAGGFGQQQAASEATEGDTTSNHFSTVNQGLYLRITFTFI